MKKGLYRDTRPQEQPEGTYVFGKNGIQHYKEGVVFNEPGMRLTAAAIPYPPNGIIELDSKAVIFSTNDINSAIGYYDPATETYIPRINDIDLPFRLNFDPDKPITGEWERNDLGENIIVFRDDINPPRYLNLDNPGPLTSVKNLNLFLEANAPTINTQVVSGGSLLRGAYYIATGYANKDGSETGFLTISQPVSISGESDMTDKAIEITITETDPNYELIRVVILSKIGGVFEARELLPMSNNGTITIIYTGDNFTTALTVGEVITPTVSYTRAGAVGTLNGNIYLGDLETRPRVNWQKYANLIKVRWKSEIVSPSDADIATGKTRHYAHGEVYALYARLRFTDGTASQAFHIPGNAPTPASMDNVTVSSSTYKRYQVETVMPSVNIATKMGDTGIWINPAELYPDDPEGSFNSTSIGGPNLVGLPVRHHKMPTIKYIADNIQPSINYGIDTLDTLGLEISNIIIPAELTNQVSKVEIFYAKRNRPTQLGMTLIYCSADAAGQPTSKDVGLVSTGGNFKARMSGDGGYFGHLDINRTAIRMYPFDMLFNRPGIPDKAIINFHYKLKKTGLGVAGVDLFSAGTTGSDGVNPKPYVQFIDYFGGATKVPMTGNSAREVTHLEYVTNNANTGRYNNSTLETFVGARLPQAEPLNVTTYGYLMVTQENNDREQIHTEEIHVGSVVVVPDELYNSFLGQELVYTGHSLSPSEVKVIYGGDMSVCAYTFNNYGWTASNNPGGHQDGASTPNTALGTRIGRRFVCESVSNINLRYAIPGNIYSQWIPNNPMSNGSGYMIDWNRSIDPNQFGYNKDLNAINDIIPVSAFNVNVNDVYKFPYRVHRGGTFKVEGKQRRSWRTLLPADYYEMPKSFGPVFNLEGYNDNLLIHMRNALFVTQDKSKLETSEIGITLGTGDIFQFNPKEALDYSLGYAGTQHKLACKKLPIGYAFVDAERGQFFIYDGSLTLRNEGLNLFLKKYLPKLVGQDNVFNGNGITIGYDPTYERVLLTSKYTALEAGISNFVPNYEETPEFFATLIPNVSVVYKDGRYQRFLGVNPFAGTYDCITNPPPSLGNYSTTITQDQAIGSTLLTILATGGNPPLNYFITSGNPGFFSLSATGVLTVSNTALPGVYTMTTSVQDAYSLSDTGQIIVTVTATPQAPIISDAFNLSPPEHMIEGTPVVLMPISNPADGPFEASIISDSPYSEMFEVNTSEYPGKVVMKTTATFSVHGAPEDAAHGIPASPFTRTLQVKVWNSANASKFDMVNVNFVFGIVECPPTPSVITASVIETAVAGTLVGTLTATDDNEPPIPITPYTYEIVYQDRPWFVLAGANNSELRVAPDVEMNPYDRETVSVWIKATDYTGRSSSTESLITITEDASTLEWQPYDFVCEPNTTPLPPTPSADFLVFNILLDNPNYTTDAADVLGYISSPGLVGTNAQVDRNILRQLPATSDNDAIILASERSAQSGVNNVLYRFIVDYARVAVLNPGILELKFKVHLKVTSGDAFVGANRAVFNRQTGGTKIQQLAASGALVPTLVGATSLDTTIITPAFPTGAAGPLNTVSVPPFIEITYNYATFAMSYSLL